MVKHGLFSRVVVDMDIHSMDISMDISIDISTDISMCGYET